MGVDDALGLILQSVARLVLKGAARLVTSKLVYSTGAGQRARSVLPPVHEVSNIDITVGVRVLALPVEEAYSEAPFVSVPIRQRHFACPMEPVVDEVAFVCWDTQIM